MTLELSPDEEEILLQMYEDAASSTDVIFYNLYRPCHRITCDDTVDAYNVSTPPSSSSSSRGLLHRIIGGAEVYDAWRVASVGTLAAAISVVTVLGNMTVILSFILERSIRQTTNYFIASLAVTDLLIGCISMPLYTVYLLSDQTWLFGETLCDLWLALDYTLCLCSIYTVFCITIDRYCSVTIPAKYRKWRTERKVVVAVAVTWVVPVLVFFPSVIGWQHIVDVGRTVGAGKCYVQYMESALFNCLLQIGYFWATLVVMCTLYAGIYRVALRLHRQAKYRRRRMMSLVSVAGETLTNIGIGVTESVGGRTVSIPMLPVAAATRQSSVVSSKTGSNSTDFFEKPSQYDDDDNGEDDDYDDDDDDRYRSRNGDFESFVGSFKSFDNDEYKSDDRLAVDCYGKSTRIFRRSKTMSGGFCGGGKMPLLAQASIERKANFGEEVRDNQYVLLPTDDVFQAYPPGNRRETSQQQKQGSAKLQKRLVLGEDENERRRINDSVVVVAVKATEDDDDDHVFPVFSEERETESIKSVARRTQTTSNHSLSSAAAVKPSEEIEARKTQSNGHLFVKALSFAGHIQRRQNQPRDAGLQSQVPHSSRDLLDTWPRPKNCVQQAAEDDYESGERVAEGDCTRRGRKTEGNDLEQESIRDSREKLELQQQQQQQKENDAGGGGNCRISIPSYATVSKHYFAREDDRQVVTLVTSVKPNNNAVCKQAAGNTKARNNSLTVGLYSRNVTSGVVSTGLRRSASKSSKKTGPATGKGPAAATRLSRLLRGGGKDSAKKSKNADDRSGCTCRPESAAAGRFGLPVLRQFSSGKHQVLHRRRRTRTRRCGNSSATATAASRQKAKTENHAKKSVRTITFILGAFVLCWTPWHVLSLIIGFCAGSDCVPSLLYDVSYWLCYLNSPLNPFCYAFANQQFKKTFVRILKFDWRRN